MERGEEMRGPKGAWGVSSRGDVPRARAGLGPQQRRQQGDGMIRRRDGEKRRDAAARRHALVEPMAERGAVVEHEQPQQRERALHRLELVVLEERREARDERREETVREPLLGGRERDALCRRLHRHRCCAAAARATAGDASRRAALAARRRGRRRRRVVVVALGERARARERDRDERREHLMFGAGGTTHMWQRPS